MEGLRGGPEGRGGGVRLGGRAQRGDGTQDYTWKARIPELCRSSPRSTPPPPPPRNKWIS